MESFSGNIGNTGTVRPYIHTYMTCIGNPWLGWFLIDSRWGTALTCCPFAVWLSVCCVWCSVCCSVAGRGCRVRTAHIECGSSLFFVLFDLCFFVRGSHFALGLIATLALFRWCWFVVCAGLFFWRFGHHPLLQPVTAIF